MKSKKAIKKLNNIVNDMIKDFETLFNERLAVKASIENLQSDLKTIAKHVQNLEAEKEKNCSCKTYYTPMSAIDLIKNPEFNTCHTNTQKTDKNATERQGEGKKEYSESPSILEMDMERGLRNPDGSHTELGAKLIKEAYDNNKQYFKKSKPETASELSSTQLREALNNIISLPDSATIEMLRDNLPNETIVTSEMFNEELERFLRLEKVITPYIKYTSTKNTPEYIASLIYALGERINCPQAINLIRSKLKSKGEHYNKETDRYANIKDALKRNKEEQPHLFANWTVVDKINSYKDKHVQWLIDTRGTKQTKTDLQEAYIDVICYCIMCYIYLKFNGEVSNG